MGMSSSAIDNVLLLSEHAGETYTKVLDRLHSLLQPTTYVEIGTAHGDTLALAGCASVAIDPRFQLKHDIVGSKPACHLFQMTSDAFFSCYHLSEVLGGPVDMAFLDGMHEYEFLLRDFINIEKHCSKNSTVLLHDCLPTDRYVARRDPGDQSLAELSPHREWWAGDVWKAAAIIRQHRRDLLMLGVNAPPTGLIVITNLDPGSKVLSSQYETAIQDFAAVPADEHFRIFAESIAMVPTAEVSEAGLLRRLLREP